MLKQTSIALMLTVGAAVSALAEPPVASGEYSSAVAHSSLPNTEGIPAQAVPNIDIMSTQAISAGKATFARGTVSAGQRIEAMLQGEGKPGEVVVSSSNPDVVYTFLPNSWIEKKNTRYGTVEYRRPRPAHQRYNDKGGR